MAPDLINPRSVSAAAYRLLTRLDAYACRLESLADRWPSEDAYLQATEVLDTMRLEARQLAPLHADWVRLVISHAETIQAFHRCQDIGERLDALERHVGIVLEVEGRCLQMATRPALRGEQSGDA